MSVTFSIIAPDSAEYPLAASGTGWQRVLEDLPAGSVGIAPVEYQTVPLTSRDGIVVQSARLGARVIDIPVALIAGNVAGMLSAIQPLYQATSVRTGALAPCRLKAAMGAKVAYLDMYLSGEAWSEVAGRGSAARRVALRFLCPSPYWYGDTVTQVTLTRNTSVTTNYIAARLAGATGAAWSGMAGGVNGWVNALAVAPDGTLYAGGLFTTAGGVTVNRIARWTGSAWSALGSGMNNVVEALAIAPDGTLYAGGDFTTAGGVTANYIARWTGSAWEPLGTGMNEGVRALAVAPDGTLYAGGWFTTAGGVTVNRIARWTGSAWSALGSGMNNVVEALAVAPDGTLYAGGLFTTAGGVTVNRIARWTGSAWSALGTGMNDTVWALAVALDNTLYAGGEFTTAGGVTVNRIARWTGSAWEPLGTGMNGAVRALAVAPDGTLYAGGFFTTAGGSALADRMAIWNGSRWLALDIDLPGAAYVYAIALHSGRMYVGFDASGSASSSVVHSVTAPASVVRPRLVFTGPLTPQVIVNETTGKRVWFNFSLPAGEVVTVDFDSLKVTSNWRGNLLAAVVPGSDFGDFALVRGENLITFYATGTGTARLEYVPRWPTLAEAMA